MRHAFRIQPWDPAAILAALVAAALLLPSLAGATDAPPVTPTCKCPVPATPDDTAPPPRPKVAEIRPLFDARDEAAALEAVVFALTEVGDGSTYVWYRHGGRLSGLVQPTQSFRDAFGRICRHLVVTLNDANRSKRAEGIACRLDDGGWSLEG